MYIREQLSIVTKREYKDCVGHGICCNTMAICALKYNYADGRLVIPNTVSYIPHKL